MNFKTLLLVSYFFIKATTLWAAKANPMPFVATQSDGTTLTVRLRGDENFSWFSTLDGVILSRSGNDFFIADIDENGDITPTTLLAHEKTARSFLEMNAVAKQNTAVFFSKDAQQRRLSRQNISINTNSKPSYFPHSGSPTAIVILVNFLDVKFTVNDPVVSFNQFLNGDEQEDYGYGENMNYGSVRKYFSDMSNGEFTPNFEVVGPVTVTDSMKYYGADKNGYQDYNYLEMVRQACTLASTQIDFSDSKYDADDDGYIDLLYVIYAGYGQSNNASDETIWPKSSTSYVGTYDGKKVSRHGVSNELNANPYITSGTFATPKIDGIGLFCHEFSHCLGLPDIYPYTESARIDNQEMEYWDLMDGGEYTKNGYYPTAYTAWEREVMGWHTITELTESQTVTATPVNSGGQSYKMVNPNDQDEYFVIENVQRQGWNSYLYGHGLIVYHVKYPYEYVNSYSRPNDVAGKPGIALVPADSILISSYNEDYTSKQYRDSHYGDPFPGTSEVEKLTYEQSLPNFLWYTSGPTVNKSLLNITENTSAGTVTFDYVHDTTSSINTPIAIRQQAHNKGVYTADGVYIGTELPKTVHGLYIVDGKKVLVK